MVDERDDFDSKGQLLLIGKYIRSWRLNYFNFTLRQMADLSGIHFNTISRIERGMPCRTDTLMLLLYFMELSPLVLMEETIT